MSTKAQVTDLRCQVPAGVIAVGRDPVRLTWRVSGAPGDWQHAYEIETSSAPDFDVVSAGSGVVGGTDQVAVPAPGDPLQSREVRHLRVRVETSTGWTAWSPVLRVEAGLLEAGDWVAQAITLPDDPGSERQAPAPILRRSFALASDVVRARLYATALGVYRMTINGVSVSGDLLAPGWTTYRHRLLVDTYDVTALLRVGENVIGGVLGDGWYRGRLGWEPQNDRGRYGTELGLIAQLEVALADGTTQRVPTDTSWLASTGEIRSADLYDGATIDFRASRAGWDQPGFEATGWQPVAVVPFDPNLIEPRIAPPVRNVDVLTVGQALGSNGSVLLDAGQNISGYVRLRVRGNGGDQVTVRHAEVLEPDGSLHTRSLRSAKATDAYTLADAGETVLEPAFTFHGFRYAQVDTTAEIIDAAFVVVSSDTQRRGRFECSFGPLNRLHENVVWSQRGNFVSVPTDCPQRDERLGWTGDAQAFASTASVLFDVEAFWVSWLRDLALEQDPILGVPSVVPDVVLGGVPRYGRAGWGDAATIVPWAAYEAYGDPHILATQWDSMVAWVGSLRGRLGPDGLLPTAMQFGDWLDPDAPADRPWEAKADADYLANAFFSHSARLVARAATVLGRPADADAFGDLADRQTAATWTRWASHAVTTQTGCAVALQFRICPDAERGAVAAALGRLVRKAGGRLATGFLGTPLVLPALADAELIDEAYLMLLCRSVPSWLYQVDQGASTVWERWDAIRPDGSIHPGTMSLPPGLPASGHEPHMLSFNHYAYGAVIDWVYRFVAGLSPDIDRPGYQRVIFAPKPSVDIDWARATVETGFGMVATAWRLTDDGDLHVELDLPFGTTGQFRAPATARSVVSVDGSAASAEPDLGSGHHVIVVTEPRIAGGAPDAMPEALLTEPAV